MEHYQFSQEHNEMIVNAIVSGYQKYVDLRCELDKKMAISFAFAWTKENFIESEVADVCAKNGFTVKLSKAGPSWDYLQFLNDETKSLFLIKNAGYFNQPGFSNSRILIPESSQGNSLTYLQELAKMNQGIDFSTKYQLEESYDLDQGNLTLTYTETQKSEQLPLLRSEYDSFHILTYQLDRAHQIKQIMHYLPDPVDNVGYLLKDLSNYITGNELTREERIVLASGEPEEYFEPKVFDLGTPNN